MGQSWQGWTRLRHRRPSRSRVVCPCAMLSGGGLDGIMACGTPSADRLPDGRLEDCRPSGVRASALVPWLLPVLTGPCGADAAPLPFALVPFSLPLGDSSWCARAAVGAKERRRRVATVRDKCRTLDLRILDMDVLSTCCWWLVILGFFCSGLRRDA